MNEYLIEDPETGEFYRVIGETQKEAFIKFLTKVLEQDLVSVYDLIDSLNYKIHDYKDIPLYE